MKNITIEQIRKPTTRSSGMWLVRRGGSSGTILGFLEKFKNDPETEHPWKAFLGHGVRAEYLGAFYEGQDAAVQAILTGKSKL